MKDNLKASMKEAMKAKDKVRLQTIRSLLSALQYEEMQKGVDELEEKDCVAVFKSEIKKRKESLEYAEKESREDQIADLNKEIATIEEFLPSQLSAEQLETIVQDMKSENPEIQLGAVMKTLKDSYAGQYDGKLASEIARKVVG